MGMSKMTTNFTTQRTQPTLGMAPRQEMSVAFETNMMKLTPTPKKTKKVKNLKMQKNSYFWNLKRKNNKFIKQLKLLQKVGRVGVYKKSRGYGGKLKEAR